MEADVNITVWNHIGKKYMIEKLQNPTRKLLTPTRTGTFSFSRKGASTGSTTTFSSMMMNRKKNTMAATKVERTRGLLHYSIFENKYQQRMGHTRYTPGAVRCSDNSRTVGRKTPGNVSMLTRQKAEEVTYPHKSSNDTAVVDPSENFFRCLTLSLCSTNGHC